MEKFIIMPDGSLEHDATGLIPENCPIDPITTLTQETVDQLVATQAMRRIFHRLTSEELREVGDLHGDPADIKTPLGHYIASMISGSKHAFAMMLATRSFPGIKTDAIFNEGKFSGDSGKLGPEQLWLKEQAESQGISTNGKWYSKGLASYPGDPTAWVDGMSDVRRIAAEKNMTVHGYVEQRGREVAPMPDIAIDPKLVAREAREIVAEHPGARYEEVYEQVHEVRTGRVDPHPLLVQE